MELLQSHFIEFHTPTGPLFLAATEKGIRYCVWEKPSDARIMEFDCLPEESQEFSILHAAITSLEEYFSGSRREFDIPLDLPPLTEFRRKVMAEMAAIPYGETLSYMELSRRAGYPAASRGVGQVCARNPVSIFIPCHRVVASSGKLHGYAGGLEAKRWLLDLETQTTLPLF